MSDSIKKIDKKIYYPLLVSENMNGGWMSLEEDHAVWSAFLLLDEEKRNILTSDELPQKIKYLQEMFRCNDREIEGVSVLVRWFFFEEIDMAGLQGGLQDIFGEKATEVAEFIEKEILTIVPKPRAEESEETGEDEAREEERMTVSLPILQALSKYENLGNQLITQERIKIKTQGESVRPSLFYWLRYYRDELGIGQHNSVERGDFLFRSENGKRLSPEERERVNLILKSIEENLPLTVDTKQQEIIFPAFQGVLVSPRESGSGRLSQTTEQNVAGREIRNGIGNMPIVAIPSVPLASNERQTFFHSIDQAETPRVTIQTDILSETGSVPLARHDLHNNSGEPARHDLHNNSGGMSFSSSHTFPAEKDVKEQKPQSAPHLFNPFSIRPVSRREEDDK